MVSRGTGRVGLWLLIASAFLVVGGAMFVSGRRDGLLLSLGALGPLVAAALQIKRWRAARRLEVGAATIIVEGLYRVRTGKAPTTLLDGVSIVSVATTHPPELDTRARARVLELEGVRYVLEWL